MWYILKYNIEIHRHYIKGLVQEGRNSTAIALLYQPIDKKIGISTKD